MSVAGGARTGGPRSPGGTGAGIGTGTGTGTGRTADRRAGAQGGVAVRLPGSGSWSRLRQTGPRGRHGFPLDQVADFRRVRLLDEFVAHVGRSGFAGTRVSEVCRAAGASTKAFYGAFGSKRACLLRAFDLGAALLCEQALASFEVTSGPWHTRVRAAVDAALGILAANPPFARVALVEVPRLGADGVARLDAVVARFLDRLGGDDGGPAPAEAPAEVAAGTRAAAGYHDALVAAVVCLLAARVEAGEAERLAELAPAVVRWLPGEGGFRAWTDPPDRIIQVRNDARSFSPAPAVVQLGPSPDDAQ